MSGGCAEFWSALGNAMRNVGPMALPRFSRSGDLGHGNGIDNDLTSGTSEAQQAGAAASEAGANAGSNQITGTCPLCKVAIVIGHNSVAQGADSAGVPEFVYNSDIASRTLSKISQLGGGRVTAQIFTRTRGTGEMARVYAQVNAFLDGVSNEKKISIELHYNSTGSSSARYALTLYKGNIGFAQRTADAMAAVFGGRALIKHYTENERGQATFTSGPTNTYLMEPFFGSNPASRDIALTEAGKDQLAEIYASELVAWIL